MVTATIDEIYAAEGLLLAVGAKLLDLTIDLSAATPHDCPPISHYRLVIRERVWLRKLNIASGDEPEAGACLGLCTTDSDESLETAPVRDVRFAIAGILPRPAFGE